MPFVRALSHPNTGAGKNTATQTSESMREAGSSDGEARYTVADGSARP